MTFAELGETTLPSRQTVTAEDASEEAAELALEAAAFASLSLSMDTDLPGRLVAVGEGPLVEWSAIESFHAESAQGQAIAATLPSISEQDELDAAVEKLWEHSLEWYDVTERDKLVRQGRRP